jgi:predicted nucleic acid-binding protein
VTILLDAFAMIAFLREEPAALEVESIIRGGQAVMCTINLAESLDVLQRIHGSTRRELDVLVGPLLRERVELLPLDEGTARDAAELRARHYHRTRTPVSMADCVAIAAARSLGAAVATADPVFVAICSVEDVDVVRLPDSGGRQPG